MMADRADQARCANSSVRCGHLATMDVNRHARSLPRSRRARSDTPDSAGPDSTPGDTHEGHRWRHDELMNELGQGLAALLDDVAAAGQADRVLLAATSEFGRRPQENGYGTDHGAASVALPAGAVASGQVGEPSPLERFDRNDNLVATTDMSSCYATLAGAWLDVDPAAVLPGTPRPRWFAKSADHDKTVEYLTLAAGSRSLNSDHMIEAYERALGDIIDNLAQLRRACASS
ncbi:MAG: DUF1501 domain-containing protein [Acidimicrobiales bacterium]|jgi:hypothetical protein